MLLITEVCCPLRDVLLTAMLLLNADMPESVIAAFSVCVYELSDDAVFTVCAVAGSVVLTVMSICLNSCCLRKLARRKVIAFVNVAVINDGETPNVLATVFI